MRKRKSGYWILRKIDYISGWDEDKDGENHKEYLVFLDDKGEEISRIEEYFLKLENDLLIRI